MTNASSAMKLTKHHGLGNDFLIHFADVVPSDAAERARKLCHRTEGVGADGLIFGLEGDGGPQFVLFNADGSRAEISGNGMRCFGQALALRDGVSAATYTVMTDAGPKSVEVWLTDGPVGSATVDMGVATDGPVVAPDLIEATIHHTEAATVDLGNPHVVIRVDDPVAHDMAIVGPAIEAAYLPTGINVHLIAPEADGLRMNIWERGAGVTEACGSGACAAATVAHRWGLVGTDVSVAMPGGTVEVSLVEDSGTTRVTLRGPTAYVASVTVPWPTEVRCG